MLKLMNSFLKKEEEEQVPKLKINYIKEKTEQDKNKVFVQQEKNTEHSKKYLCNGYIECDHVQKNKNFTTGNLVKFIYKKDIKRLKYNNYNLV